MISHLLAEEIAVRIKQDAGVFSVILVAAGIQLGAIPPTGAGQ